VDECAANAPSTRGTAGAVITCGVATKRPAGQDLEAGWPICATMQPPADGPRTSHAAGFSAVPRVRRKRTLLSSDRRDHAFGIHERRPGEREQIESVCSSPHRIPELTCSGASAEDNGEVRA